MHLKIPAGPFFDLPFWLSLAWVLVAVVISGLSLRYRRFMVFSIIFAMGLTLGGVYTLKDSLSPQGREDWRILLLMMPAGLAFIAGLVLQALAALGDFVLDRFTRRTPEGRQ